MKAYPKARPVSPTDSTLIFEWPGRLVEGLIGRWTVPPDDEHFEVEVMHRWGYAVPRRVKALAMDRDGTIYGKRVLFDVREDGHQLCGRVSIDGRKHKAFTSDRLFLNADGKLVKVAVLHVCLPQPVEPT